MVRIRENWQKQLTSRVTDMEFLRAVPMFVGLIINVLLIEENAP
jgi:hypothetical protein